jgi:hypothetical protein
MKLHSRAVIHNWELNPGIDFGARSVAGAGIQYGAVIQIYYSMLPDPTPELKEIFTA